MRHRLFTLLARLISRHPWGVLGVALAFTLASAWLAGTRLHTNANQDDLVSEQLPYHHRYMEYLRDFGDHEYLFIVVESAGNQERARAFLDALATRLRALPQLDAVMAKFDDPLFTQSALLFLDTPQLEQLVGFLTAPGFSPTALARVRGLDDLFELINGKLDAPPTSADRAVLEPMFRGLADLIHGMVTAADGTAPYQSPFAKLLHPAGRGIAPDDAGYFSADGKLLFLFILPRKDYRTLEVIAEPLRAIRAALAGTRAEFPDINAGLTGRPVLAADEMTITNRDMTRSTIVALLAVWLLFALFLRRFMTPGFAVLALACGITWTYGFATLAIGSLNLLSIIFAVVLVGAGIEFGLHIVSRYGEERARGATPEAAVTTILTHTGRGNLTACLTTAAAFFAALGTQFLALRELGAIAGVGILLCLSAMFTVLPALLLLWDRWHSRPQPPATSHQSPATSHQSRFDPLAPLARLAAHPRWTLLAGIILCAVATPYCFRIDFDHNLLNLQAAGLESVRYERLITDQTEGSTWEAVVLQRDLDAVATQAAAFRALPSVGQVESILDIIPTEQAAKLALLQRVAAPSADFVLPSPRARLQVPSLLAALATFENALGPLAEAALRQGEAEAVEALDALGTELETLRTRLRSGGTPVITALETFERAFLADWQDAVRFLLQNLRPQPITAEGLPTMLKSRFIGASGAYATYITPQGDVWDPTAMATFVEALRRVAPDVTGVPVEVYESSRLLERSFRYVALLALIAILGIVGLDFRHWRMAVCAVLPLGLGLWWLGGLMGAIHLPFNLANFFAIPILIGVGVDNGVQLMHRVRQENGFTPALLRSSTGTGILLTSLTTLVSFGTLCFAEHRGIRSLGLLMTLGTLTCMAGATVMLPAWLAWRANRPCHQQAMLKVDRRSDVQSGS
ncbi:MAG: MMPL family transporter [Deltaproteobacteria bacterium]|nr:MMPL family transporter [Deltaproteobacteria bacterium]